MFAHLQTAPDAVPRLPHWAACGCVAFIWLSCLLKSHFLMHFRDVCKKSNDSLFLYSHTDLLDRRRSVTILQRGGDVTGKDISTLAMGPSLCSKSAVSLNKLQYRPNIHHLKIQNRKCSGIWNFLNTNMTPYVKNSTSGVTWWFLVKILQDKNLGWNYLQICV